MSKTMKLLAGAAVALAVSVGAALAGPVGPVAMPALPTAESDHVIKVHGFHPTCELGPAGWHRHHPAYGRIPCGPQRFAPPPPRYVPPPPPRCAFVRNRCAGLYPPGSPPFFGCIRSRGC